MNPKPETKVRPQRSDYPFKAEDLKNGDRRPTEVYKFAEAMRRWRERSSQSTLLGEQPWSVNPPCLLNTTPYRLNTS